MTLSEFLLARIAEDEAAAVKAQRRVSTWTEAEPPWTTHKRIAESVGRGAVIDAFMGRHDPARVLAECEAKRRIVVAWGRLYNGPPPGDEYARQAAETAGHVFRELAAVYADHPDYDEAWRA